MEKHKKELEGRFDLVAFAPPFVRSFQSHLPSFVADFYTGIRRTSPFWLTTKRPS